MTIYFDCDGVLANLEERLVELLGMSPRAYEIMNGDNSFWDVVYSNRPVFKDLRPMDDAFILYEALKHNDHAILTGCHRHSKEDDSPAEWARQEKTHWGSIHFPEAPVHALRSKDKRILCKPGDFLIDDWDAYRGLWEEAGGIFIHHFSAELTLRHISVEYPHLLRHGY